jgi:hypothetical protein
MPSTKQLDILGVKPHKMSNIELGTFLVGLAKALRKHPGWQAPGCIPAPLLQPDALEQVGNDHIDITKAADHDRDAIAARDASRSVTELHAVSMLRWVVIRSALEKDASLVANLDLQMKTQSYKSGNTSVTTPENVKVIHGKDGSVFVSCGRVSKASTYDVGICKGDPSLESSWSILGPFNHARNIEVTGLEPGQIYYFRVRCFGLGGTSSWSAIVSIRVL